MSRFIVNGGKKLSGIIDVGGSKNAALPVIFASIITHGRSVIYGVPNIVDVEVATELISALGAEVTKGDGVLYIDTLNMKYSRPDDTRVAKIRASSYLLGACLSRFGEADLSTFGGCNFDNRPIDMHISAIKALGGTISGSRITLLHPVGADIIFNKISVGATVNAILLASTAQGVSRIFGYAKEPHVMTLIAYLRTAGAKIRVDKDFIEIEGTHLAPGVVKIIPDMIEAGTYIALSILTGSHLTVRGVQREDLTSFFLPLAEAGACLSFFGDCTLADGSLCDELNVLTAPYPAFPTDLQPLTAPLMARYSGGSITEGVWLSRFGYLDQLAKFGVKYKRDGNFARIFPSEIRAATALATDLRGGAAALMCALYANGESVIEDAHVIKRGYEDVVGKLRRAGAEIEEVK